MNDYRNRLFRSYVSTFFSSIRDISPELLENQRKYYKLCFRRFLPKDKNSNILDLGCGYGSFVYFLKKEGYQNVSGVDTSHEQVEVSKMLGVENIHQEDALTFVHQHNSEFDCISAIDLIEHIPKDCVLEFLDSIYKALKPNGILIIKAPNGGSPFSGAYRYIDFTHSCSLTKESISQLLRAAGFTNIQVHQAGPVVHGLLSAGRWILWQVFRFIMHLYLGAETGVFRGHILTQNLISVAMKE